MLNNVMCKPEVLKTQELFTKANVLYCNFKKVNQIHNKIYWGISLVAIHFSTRFHEVQLGGFCVILPTNKCH